MKTLIRSVMVLLATMGFALNAQAQAPSCDDIVWSAEALERAPAVTRHCLEVVQRDGGWYARSHARVVRQNPASTTVNFQNADGSWSDNERVHPRMDLKAQLEDQEVAIEDMAPGQEVNIYVLDQGNFSVPDQVAAADTGMSEPEPAAEPEPEPEPEPTMLPKTAGQANWLAVIGILLIVLSGALYVRRNV